MRYREQETCIWTPGEPEDLFAEPVECLFKHYLGNQRAKIYIRNEGYKIVSLANLRHKEQVTA